jgi:hypothetical protein
MDFYRIPGNPEAVVFDPGHALYTGKACSRYRRKGPLRRPAEIPGVPDRVFAGDRRGMALIFPPAPGGISAAALRSVCCLPAIPGGLL